MITYEEVINKVLNYKVEQCKLISQSNNLVFKIVTNDSEVLYAKIYLNNSSHIDHELKLYDIVEKKYLKELVYQTEEPKLAIYKELKGKFIDELDDDELEKYSDTIVDSLIDFFTSINKLETKGYGLLTENMQGTKNTFEEFIYERQNDTATILKDYPYLNCLFNVIYDKYKDIMVGSNTLVPIDTNLKNVMLLEDGMIKFIDPGELISGPILMGYGDFTAHTYKTILYDKLMNKLSLSKTEEQLLRIYAIFSSLNILAFLHKLGVKELNKVIPYGNTYTFYQLISEHLEYLGLDEVNKKYLACE